MKLVTIHTSNQHINHCIYKTEHAMKLYNIMSYYS